jgi:hypothetical protein
VQPPGPAEQALVRAVRGEITYTYHLVLAIDALLRNPAVTGIDPDLEVRERRCLSNIFRPAKLKAPQDGHLWGLHE